MEHYAQVTMFDQKRTCKVITYGDPQQEYDKEHMLWIQRDEDWYALHHYVEPFCVLKREEWLRAGTKE
jgi:hypothetical protein